MEQLFGLIIFGIIAAISGLVKLIEKRKEEQLREQRASRRNVEDLPEATRRMLYGDDGPPVAKRRGEGAPEDAPRREPAPPQRRPVPEQRSPQVPPVTPPGRQAPAAPRQQTTQRQRPPVVPTAAPARRVQEPSSRRADQTLRDAWSRSRRDAAGQPMAPPSPPAASGRSSAPAPAPTPSSVAARRRRQSSIKALLHHPKTLRTSMVLHEVLGPPKSMR